MIAVRAARLEDAEAISALLIRSISELCVADHGNRPDALSVWLANKTPDGVRVWFANPDNRLLVAEDGGVLAAAGAYNLRREIILNYVSPSQRFRGASSALLARMERELGAGEARLASTTTALAFYRARGWIETGESEVWAGMIAHPLRKRL